MRVTQTTVANWTELVQEIKACTHLGQLQNLWFDMTSVDPEDTELEDLRADCLDHMREICVQFGVHVSTIGI